MRLVALALGVMACEGATDRAADLTPTSAPAEGAIGRRAIRPAQVVLFAGDGLPPTLVFYDQPVAAPCALPFMDEPRWGFGIGLGRDTAIAPGLDITQLGRARDPDPAHPTIGLRYANYYQPNRDWTPGAVGLASLGYGGGSYHLILDTVDAAHRTVSGRIAIGAFPQDEARLAGAFTATLCTQRG